MKRWDKYSKTKCIFKELFFILRMAFKYGLNTI
nr:MAG TPA: hypothetical protein [Bacteriophage sp.]